MQNLFKAKNQEEFLVAAYKLHRERSDNDRWDLYRGPDWKTIDWLFKLGLDYQVLNIEYEQFVRIINGEEQDYYNGHYRPYSRSRYRGSYSHFCDPELFRVLRGFTYGGQSKKNRPTKNDWWEYKGIIKDKRKSSWRRGPGKNFKHFNKRKHRQLERLAIKAERYEKLHQWSYKRAENPYSWD